MLAGATSGGGRAATGSGAGAGAGGGGAGAAIACAGGGVGGGCACEQATRARRRAESDRSDRMIEPFVWMKRAVCSIDKASKVPAVPTDVREGDRCRSSDVEDSRALRLGPPQARLESSRSMSA